MNAIRSTIQNLRNWIADIVEATKEAFAETEAQAKNTSPDLVLLLRDYLNLRKAERSDWSRYGQQKGTTDDLKAVSKAMIYLKEHELFTLEDLDVALQGMSEKSKGINPRIFAKYGRQRGWERTVSGNEQAATGSDFPDGFRELTEEEAQQIEIPF